MLILVQMVVLECTDALRILASSLNTWRMVWQIPPSSTSDIYSNSRSVSYSTMEANFPFIEQSHTVQGNKNDNTGQYVPFTFVLY